ncbi:hypothetical protein F4781DRAFT_304963 [Annulohypoxylon bovei var. microspora]|nr:hypothetical protein F4781DRAFT_304963 [Annulohypoxylon bovei var. microspora]
MASASGSGSGDVASLKAQVDRLEKALKELTVKQEKQADNPDDTTSSPSPSSANDTNLRWERFEWKLPKELRLTGPENFPMWLEMLGIALRSIGYIEGTSNITSMDDLKIANIICNNVCEDPLRLVTGLKQGTVMVTQFRTNYQARGDQQKMSLWEEFEEIKYNGGDPVTYVTTFTYLVSRNSDVGNKISDAQLRARFIRGAEDKAKDWTARQRTLLKVSTITIQVMKDDFISEFRSRIGKASGKGDSHAAGDQDGKKCWKCGKPGHIRRDCPGNSKAGDVHEIDGSAGTFKPMQVIF